MIVPEEDIREALEIVSQYLVERYDELGMRNTGDFEKELEVRTGANKGEIWGVHYAEYLAKGRPPSDKYPPIDAIHEWVMTKPNFRGERSRSVAWAIATKIKQEGTSWYQQGGTDLLEILESEEVMNVFLEALGQKMKVRIEENLKRMIKEVSA